MSTTDVATVMAKPITQELLRTEPLVRLSYTALDGGPQGYLDASHRCMPSEAWDGFDEQVHQLYEQMTEIRVVLTWAKLLDFETTAPSAVERLVRERSG
jgi:hypothetical protein